MSQYADYTLASQDYDTTRVAVGVDSILDCLERTSVALGEQTVLEAGCGTGNYLQALYPHVGNLVGVDFNEGMLAQARAKVGKHVKLVCGSILELPQADDTCDGITCNQVIHHLDAGPGKGDYPAQWKPSGFPNVTRFLHEAYRILRPGGAIVVNVSTHEQVVRGFWWAELIPRAVARLFCRLPDLDQLKQLLMAIGFEIESVDVDLGGVLQGPSYLDPLGPLDETWRAGDSTWSLASAAELATAQRQVEQLNAAGKMQAYLDQHERARQAVGQSTFICGRK